MITRIKDLLICNIF